MSDCLIIQIEFPNFQGIYCLLHWEGMVSWRLEWGCGCGGELNEPGNFDPLNSNESSLPIRNSLSTPSEAALLPLSERINPPTLAEETVRTFTWGSCHARFLTLPRTSYLPIHPQLSNIHTHTPHAHTHTLFVLDLQWDSSLEKSLSTLCRWLLWNSSWSVTRS